MDKLEKFDKIIKELEDSLNSIKNFTQLTEVLVKFQSLNEKLLDTTTEKNNLISSKLEGMESLSQSLVKATENLEKNNIERLKDISNILEKKLNSFFDENKKHYRDLDSIIDTRINKSELNISQTITETVDKSTVSIEEKLTEELEKYKNVPFLLSIILIGIIGIILDRAMNILQ
jgi:exonuclease VII large subunit